MSLTRTDLLNIAIALIRSFFEDRRRSRRLRFLVVAHYQPKIAFVPKLRDQVSSNCSTDRAAVLDHVQTVGEFALWNERAKFEKIPFHLFGVDVPQLQLSNPWCVDNPATKFQLSQLSKSGSMAALLRDPADVARFERKSRLNGVQQ